MKKWMQAGEGKFKRQTDMRVAAKNRALSAELTCLIWALAVFNRNVLLRG